MSYQVFARKYRPKTFADVLGQDHVIQTLRNAIEQDRLAHAYLFVGPRGTGKTSTARILAKALNCKDGPRIDFDPEEPICREIAEGRSLDVIEIDGASTNGVDHVRDLRENARFAPSSCRYKIYYIDEVHMLSNAAFNALLKTLEEPPPHVKFIFATTEPNKILPTIISRCQRFDLKPISTQTIADHLQFIAQNEGVDLDPSAAWTIAKGADGGMRDAQSMLDQLVAFCGNNISENNVIDVFGFTSRETVADISRCILTKDTASALSLLNNQAEAGKDLSQLLDNAIGCLRSLLVAKVDPHAENDGIPEILWKPLIDASKPIPTDRLLNLIDIFADTDGRMKWATNKKLHFEIGIIKAIHSLNDIRISDVIKALAGAGPVTLKTENVASENTSTVPQPKVEPGDPPPQSGQTDSRESETEAASTPPAEVPQPAPPTVENAQAKHPKVAQSPPAPKKKDIFSSLDNYIEDAPETAPAAPEPAVIEKQKHAEAQQASPEAPTDTQNEDEKPDLAEDFYNEPLIKEALEKFKGTLIKQ